MELNILNYLNKECIVLEPKGKNKKAIITVIVDHLIEAGKIKESQRKDILKALIQREEMGSTAIGGNIALPHARISVVKNILLAVAVSSQGLDFDSLDQAPVNIIVLLLSNQNEAGLHLKTLAFLARMLKDKYFVQKLKALKSAKEVIAAIKVQQQAVS